MSVPSSELAPPSPPAASECVSPLDPKGAGKTGEGVGEPNSDDWIESMALCMRCGISAEAFHLVPVLLRTRVLYNGIKK